jgi:hypothetical protein
VALTIHGSVIYVFTQLQSSFSMIGSTNLYPVCGHVKAYAHAQQVVFAASDLPHLSDSDMTFLFLLNGT